MNSVNSMNYFQRRKILKAISASDLIPVRVHGHEIVDGKVVILVPKFQSNWLHYFFPGVIKLFYKIKLDEIGSLTWENITGDTTVTEITTAVQNQLGEKARSFDEAESRVSKFIAILYDWKYVTFRQIM